MLNNIITIVREQVEQTKHVQENIDPVSLLIKNLSSGTNWYVKLRNDESPLNPTNETKEKSIRINLDNLEKDNTDKNFNNNQPKLLNILTNKRSPGFPTQNQKIISNKLKLIPVYTVVNNCNEVIVSSPRENKQNDALNSLRKLYNDLFFWSHDEGPISVILFFMNEQDAGSYLHEICRQDPRQAEKLGLSVKSIGLDTFYKFNRTSPPKMQTRLIGDLKEMDYVINSVNKLNPRNINPKQRYSKNWFQGIPVYSIKLSVSSNQKVLVDYNIKLEEEKKYIFFRKEDAIIAWNSFTTRNKGMRINNPPNLELYNLENLLLDLEKTGAENMSNTILVPPYESSRESTLHKIPNVDIEYSKQTRIIYNMKLKLEEIKRFYKGLLWLVTSDTLPSEENSW